MPWQTIGPLAAGGRSVRRTTIDLGPFRDTVPRRWIANQPDCPGLVRQVVNASLIRRVSLRNRPDCHEVSAPGLGERSVTHPDDPGGCRAPVHGVGSHVAHSWGDPIYAYCAPDQDEDEQPRVLYGLGEQGAPAGAAECCNKIGLPLLDDILADVEVGDVRHSARIDLRDRRVLGVGVEVGLGGTRVGLQEAAELGVVVAGVHVQQTG